VPVIVQPGQAVELLVLFDMSSSLERRNDGGGLNAYSLYKGFDNVCRWGKHEFVFKVRKR
jgi:hypothetical protein